jgi:NADP-dependent 3-hydroxy acid dehydrogenase YdfG
MEAPTAYKVGVITGATGGVGSVVAKALSQAGWRLVLSARPAEKLDALASHLGSNVAVIPGDLQDPSLPQAMLSVALENFGRCDMCFNNAGSLEAGSVGTIDIERVCEMVRVNVEGSFRVAYVFLQHFVREKSGHLMNVSSVLGKRVQPTAGAYAATKYAMEAFSDALRVELSRTDVKVSCIQSGQVISGLRDHSEVHPSQLMAIAEPLTPNDIARMLLYMFNQPPQVRIPPAHDPAQRPRDLSPAPKLS